MKSCLSVNNCQPSTKCGVKHLAGEKMPTTISALPCMAMMIVRPELTLAVKAKLAPIHVKKKSLFFLRTTIISFVTLPKITVLG